MDVELSSPIKFGQTLIWSEEGTSTLFLTEESLKIFVNNKLTGCDFVESNVLGYKGESRASTPLPRLWELRVTNWVAIDRESSGYVLEEPACDICGWTQVKKTRQGIWLAESSDLDFLVVREYPLHILVTERVMELIVAAELHPCALVPQDKIEFEGVFVD